MHTLRLGAALALALTTACSSSHGATTLPLTPTAPTSGGGNPVTGTQASLRITVPRAGTATSSTTRRPRYVSPSSAKLLVAVNGGTTTTYGLTPSTPGCTVQVTTLLCTFAIPAPSGPDTLAMSLTDGAGNVLSRNVVTATLAPGVATPVAVTLAGVPTSVAVVPGANATVDGTKAPYHVAGLFAQPVEIEPLDADGNVIIGPGAPTITGATISAGSAYAAIASAQTTDPNAYILRAVDGSAGGHTVTVSATAQGVPLADGTTSAPISATTDFAYTPAIAVANGLVVNVFSLESQKIVAQFRSCVCAGLTFTRDLKVDSKGQLYALTLSFLGLSQTGIVNVFAPGATAAGSAITSGVHVAAALALDKNDNLYVVNGSGFRQPPPSLSKYARGTTTPAFTISGSAAQISQPAGLAVDASGNIYLSEENGSINVYAPGTTVPAQVLSDPSLTQPGSIALDASGGLYVADAANEDIAYFAPGSSTLTSTLSDPSFSNWNGNSYLMVDGGGNLWSSVAASPGEVEEIGAAGLPNTVSVVNVISGVAGPMAIIP